MTRIYISSTCSDLVEYREAAYDALKRLRYDVVAMEDYLATDERPAEKCLNDVAECDIYVGIVAWRYGFIPPGETRSITELEYREACKSGLSRFIFVLDEDTPWPRSKMEGGVASEKLHEWREELGAAHVIRSFTDPDDLARQTVDTVAAWAKEQLDRSMGALRARQTEMPARRRDNYRIQNIVNVRPLDVGLTFKGRERETDELRAYLAEPQIHMVSVLGRGGMGKTALVTRVLAELERGQLFAPGDEVGRPIDGIVYLSAQNSRITLERLFTDTARMFDRKVAGAMAARWANTSMSLAAKAEYLIEVMAEGTYVILLDNFEDELTSDGTIIDEGLRAFVEQSITKPSGVTLVVTSREKLKLPAAALRAARTISLSEGLSDSEAIALLRDLDAQGMLGLRDAPEADLKRAARLTRGIPRALEILSGLLYEDPTTDLMQLLSSKELFGTEVMGPLVQAGYQRLEEPERRIMEALAVFKDQVDETAIAYLVQPWAPGLDVRASLRRLINGHFVNLNSGTGQYSLHTLDQEYAYHQIPDTAHAEGMRIHASI